MRVVGIVVCVLMMPQVAWAGGIDEISASNFPALPCSEFEFRVVDMFSNSAVSLATTRRLATTRCVLLLAD